MWLLWHTDLSVKLRRLAYDRGKRSTEGEIGTISRLFCRAMDGEPESGILVSIGIGQIMQSRAGIRTETAL